MHPDRFIPTQPLTNNLLPEMRLLIVNSIGNAQFDRSSFSRADVIPAEELKEAGPRLLIGQFRATFNCVLLRDAPVLSNVPLRPGIDFRVASLEWNSDH